SGELSVATSAEEAVRGADVVVAVTNSREPVLQRAWLTPGAHVNAVGASTLQTRELDSETVAASALFCDSRESLRNEAGEFARAVAEGAVPGEEHIRAELGEVLAGMAPRRSGRSRRPGNAASAPRWSCDRADRDRGGARADRRGRGPHAAGAPAGRGR